MAFPASTVLLPKATERISEEMAGVKADAQNVRSQSAAGPVTSAALLAYLTRLMDARDRMAAIASTPGLTEYARTAYNNQALDIVAEYNATVVQIDATRTWMVNAFPKDAGGNLLAAKLDANGRTVPNTFSTAALAGFRSALDALIATIN